MNDVILINDQWYVLATSSRADGRSLVMKNEETCGLFDRFGDIQHVGVGEQGLYHRGTRHLSLYEMLINDRRPMLLNSSVARNNNALAVDLTTPDLYQDDKLLILKGTVHILRARFLCHGVCYDHIRIRNFSPHQTDFGINFRFDADFADIFEVRGQKRSRRGKFAPAELKPGELILGYLGLDKVKRQTRIAFEPAPDRLSEDKAAYVFSLQPRGEAEIFLTISCLNGQDRPLTVPYATALAENKSNWTRKQAGAAIVSSSNEQFNDWLNRSLADLLMLVTTTSHGQYPYAGVPWFSTPFGRDGIIAAWQTLWINPDLARGVLAFLAQNQAEEEIPAQDAEPGKILHETRQGEMATLGEVPFRRYYGSVDATPLFVMLAGQYFTRTGDQAFLESIWPCVKRALNWIDTYGDQDGDGFVEYARKSGQGIIQQGWKDSNDSVFHQDGSPAKGPIALCEVQGYVYRAKLTGAELATVLGEKPLAASLRAAAEILKKRFNQAFWCDEINSFALALDGEKQPCQVLASNAGHALFTGIAAEKYAKILAETLFRNDFFSGWGIRTVAATEKRYNPMSYHNGSVWPHDNAIIAMGLARYGYKDAVLRILTGLFDASIVLDLHRLPELFCGFSRLPGQGPTLYPVACAPQAWAAGTVYALLQACLGLTFSPEKPHLRFCHPLLPDYIDFLKINNLRVGTGIVDLALRRHPHDVGINITRKQGDVEVAVII